MNDREFIEILALGHELNGIEFKGPGSASDKQPFAQVAKAVLGMANRRNGGRIVIGVEDNAGVLNPVGLNDSELSTWRYDDVAGKLAEYADPSVNFEMDVKRHEGKNYVVLHVREFEEVPVLCKKDYQGVLRKGACYVRPRRKPETTEIPSQEDMRELIDLATEKKLRRFFTQAHRSGVGLTSRSVPTDQDLFERQLGGLR